MRPLAVVRFWRALATTTAHRLRKQVDFVPESVSPVRDQGSGVNSVEKL